MRNTAHHRPISPPSTRQKSLCPPPPHFPPGGPIPFRPCPSPLIPSPIPTHRHESTERSMHRSGHPQVAPLPQAHRGSGVSQASCYSMMSRTMFHDRVQVQFSTHHTPHSQPNANSLSTDAMDNNRWTQSHSMNRMHRRSVLLYCKPSSRAGTLPYRSQSINSRRWNGWASSTLHSYHIVPSNTHDIPGSD
jgi:hypothetical protein